MSKHTATPWKISDVGAGFEIDDSLDRPVAQAFERYSKSNDERREIAAHIVRCVNTHDALISVLQESLEAMQRVEGRYPNNVGMSAVRAAIAKAELALAAARGTEDRT